MNAEWEIVHHDQGLSRAPHLTERMAVPGGWLYRTIISTYGVAMVFVPDPAEALRLEQQRSALAYATTSRR